VLKRDDHLTRLRARQRINSARYRERNPRQGDRKVVFRTAVSLERVRYRLVVEGLIGKDASRAKIEIGWSQFTGELLDELEQGKKYRHR